MKKPTYHKFTALLFCFSIIGIGIACNQKTQGESTLNTKEEFSHIRLGLRGESLFYKLQEQEYEIWSTGMEERHVYLDNLDKTQLREEEKTKIFLDIINFIQKTENRKPVLFYNEDLQSSDLWKALCEKHASEIKRVEVTNTQQENIDFYNALVEQLQDEGAEINIKGFTIKSVKELDEHWDEIRQ